MPVFGELERLLASLYPHRAPLTVLLVVTIVLLGFGADRGELHRIARQHPRTSGVIVALAVVIAIPLGNYLLSPLWTRVVVEETSPLVSEASASTSGSRVLRHGEFRGADEFHFGSGRALLIEAAPGKHVLRFENFSVQNGPDLYVYLSSNADGWAPDALNLGMLRASDGSLNYDVPDGTDLDRYRSAVVWCRRFGVLFATATLGSV